MKEMSTNRSPNLHKLNLKWDTSHGKWAIRQFSWGPGNDFSVLQVQMYHVLRDFLHVFQIPWIEALMGLAFGWPGIGYGL